MFKKMLTRSIKAAALLTLMIFAGVASQATGAGAELPGDWFTDWDKAVSHAKETDKPILAVFSAEWCGPCQLMRQNVYPLPEVQAELENWTPVYVDVDEEGNRELAIKYDAASIPKFVLLSPELQPERDFVGYRTPEAFVQLLSGHQDEMKRFASVKEQLSRNPEDPALWKELGEIHEERDEFDQAMKAYEKVAYYDPEDELGAADQLYYLKAVPHVVDDLEPARERFAKFEELFPQSELLSKVALQRAFIELNLSDPDRAREILEDAVERFPDSPEAGDMRSLLAEVSETRQ